MTTHSIGRPMHTTDAQRKRIDSAKVHKLVLRKGRSKGAVVKYGFAPKSLRYARGYPTDNRHETQ